MPSELGGVAATSTKKFSTVPFTPSPVGASTGVWGACQTVLGGRFFTNAILASRPRQMSGGIRPAQTVHKSRLANTTPPASQKAPPTPVNTKRSLHGQAPLASTFIGRW